jgi:hypothetical protein
MLSRHFSAASGAAAEADTLATVQKLVIAAGELERA